ncbi:MAG: DVUA0089 family protein [Microcoleaceae cyanobacterium]
MLNSASKDTIQEERGQVPAKSNSEKPATTDSTEERTQILDSDSSNSSNTNTLEEIINTEPNDTILEAIDTELSGGETENLLLSNFIGDNEDVSEFDDVDLYQLHLETSDLLTVDIDAAEFGSFLDPVLRLFDQEGFELAVSDDDPAPGEDFTLDSYFEFTAFSEGTYYVGVSSFSNFDYDPFTEGSGIGGSSGEYDIEFNINPDDITPPPPPPGDEPNDTILEAIDTAITGGVAESFFTFNFIGDNPNIFEFDDVDLYQVQLEANDTIAADIDAEEFGSPLDSVLRLFDESGFELTVSDDDPAPDEFGTLDSYFDFTVSSAGTYYVGVSSFSNFGYDPFTEGSGFGNSSGDYDLEINVTPDDIILPPGDDEPNDTIPEAIDTELTGGSSGNFFTASFIGDNPNVFELDDVDVYEVQLNSGDQILVDIDAAELGSFLDPVLRLFDDSGFELAVSDDTPAPDEDFSLDSYFEFTASSDGTYYVGVSSFANFDYDPFFEGSGFGGSSGDYDLNIELISATVETGSISGTKWNDLDGDGVRDDDEPGLEDWTIYIDDNQNGELDDDEVSTTTDSDGSYSFTDLDPATYIVAEELQEGWIQTFPSVDDDEEVPEIENGGFEDDFNGWETVGLTSIETSDLGSDPTEGTNQALISNDIDAVTDAALETFLNLDPGTLDGLGSGDATEGSAIAQTVTVSAGDQLSFDWNYLTNEGSGSSITDFAFVSIESEDSQILANTLSPLNLSDTGIFSEETGYGSFEYTFENGGTYTIGVGIVDVGDTVVSSGLLVDNFSFSGGSAIPGTYTIQLDAGENVEGIDFGNQEVDDTDTGIIFGTPDDDELNVFEDNVLVFAGDGDDLVDTSASSGQNRSYGGPGNDILIGGDGDRLYGGVGDDNLIATGDGVLMSGDQGADQFFVTTAFVPGSPTVVADFEAGIDLIGIGGLGLTFTDLSITQDGDDAVINGLDSDLAILLNTEASDLVADDFLFS